MQEPSPEEKQQWQTAGVAAGLGCSIVVSIIVLIVGGLLLDRWLDTEPIFTLIGVGLGLAAAGYQMYELAMMSKPGHKPGLVTRQVARVATRKTGATK